VVESAWDDWAPGRHLALSEGETYPEPEGSVCKSRMRPVSVIALCHHGSHPVEERRRDEAVIVALPSTCHRLVADYATGGGTVAGSGYADGLSDLLECTCLQLALLDCEQGSGWICSYRSAGRASEAGTCWSTDHP
jgi:hypothetical protein